MKKFLVLVFSVLSAFANGQVLQAINNYGTEVNRIKPRLYLGIPQGLGSNNIAQAGYDTANIRYNTPDSSLYIQTGSQWLKIGGAGSAPFAENGLTKTGDVIELGGTWTKNTSITGDYTKSLNIEGLSEIGMTCQNGFSFNGAGQNYMYGNWEVDGLLKGFTDLDINDSASFHGYGLLDKKFNYSSNIHGTFDNYSLIDKSYFDSVNALNAFAFTVDRGIKQVGSIIRLADTIDGAGTKFQYVYSKGGAIRSGAVTGTQWDIGNIGNYSAAFGVDTKASGSRSFAAGDGSWAAGQSSFAMGDGSTASGTSSVAFTGGTASSSYSFAMGLNSSANQVNAMSMGSNTISSAYNSFVTGEYNYANAMNLFVLGQYNDTTGYYLNSPTSKITTDPLFVIGNGSSAGARSNSLSMLKDGKTYLKNMWNYTSDLSASFTDRSLIDKGFANASFDPLGSASTAASYKVTKGGDAGSNLTIGTTTAHTLSLETNSAARMFINTSGDVGIGTSSPLFKLHLWGNGGNGAGAILGFGDGNGSDPRVSLSEYGGTDTDQPYLHGQQGLFLGAGAYGTRNFTIQTDGDIIYGGTTQVAGAEHTFIGDGDVSGNMNVQGNLTAANIISFSGVLDFPNTAAGTSSELTIAVAGAAVGDAIAPGIPTSNANSIYEYRASAANVVTVKFNNYSAAAINPASSTFKGKLFK